MKSTLKKPCNDCPFRRNATPGWLGGGTPQAFVRGALSDYPLTADERDPDCEDTIAALPCHQTVDYENVDWRETLEDAEVCVGALQFAANNFKSPRDPERSALVNAAGSNEDVFRRPDEFIHYHTR